MAENERVQLKREEVVGNEVVLSDIAPITNTESVEDSAKGMTLAQTLDKMWNDINNKLSRVVNSVNGRTGVVVLDSSDVGLENVDNVSFDDIKKWVITRIKQEFDNHILQLFDTLEEADQFAASHDESFHGTPFFSNHGRASEHELRSVIGYFYWDNGSGRLTFEHRIINTIGGTDNSIIYNEYVNGHDFTGGRIGVNIYKYETALKLYNATSGEPATQSSLEESGLYIDKDVLAHDVFVFDGCYSATSFNTFLAKQAPLLNPRVVDIWLDGSRINLGGTFYLDSGLQIKKYDIIICNFADLPEYHESDGSIKDGIYPELITGQPAIGQVVSAPDRDHPNVSYAVKFFTIRPKVDFGLTYFHQDGTDNENGEYGDPLEHAHPSILGVKPTTGYVEGVSNGNAVVNVSGLTVSGTHGKVDNESDHEANNREYATVFPHGARTVYTAMDKSVSGSCGGVSITPDMSLCVIPHGYDDTDNVTNLPIKRPGSVDDKTGNDTNMSNLGVNLLKWVLTAGGFDETNAINLSGLKIIGPSDTVRVLDPSDNTRTLDLTGDDHSGGLAVNVGEFLAIEYPTDGNAPSAANYYNSGKVIVNVNKMYGLDDVGDGKLGIKLATSHTSTGPDGGLHFGPGGELSIYLGQGLGFSRVGFRGYPDEPPSGEVNMHLCAVTVDPDTSPYDVFDSAGTSEEARHRAISNNWLGGLRYIQATGRYCSSLAVRVNEVVCWDVEDPSNIGPTRIGSNGLQIGDNNVLSVQPYKDTNKSAVNPIHIKQIRSRDILMMMDPPFNGLKEEYVVNPPQTIPPSDPNEGKIYNYHGGYYIYDAPTNSFISAFEVIDDEHPLPATGNGRVMYLEIDYNTPGSIISVKTWHKVDGVYFPDFTVPGTLTTDDADKILTEYSARSTGSIVFGYLDKINNKFYEDAARQHEISPVDGKKYSDLSNGKPTTIFKYTAATNSFDYRQDSSGNDIDETWARRADVNCDGYVSSVDASGVLGFIRRCENGEYTNDISGWKQYLIDYEHINPDEPFEGYIENLRINTDQSSVNIRDAVPGVHLEYSRYQGLRVDTSPNGGYQYDMEPLCVNIKDSTNGFATNDPYGNGGLRFGANGVLAIRINDSNNYSAIDPNRRYTHENGGYSEDKINMYAGVTTDNLKHGTRGLCIDNDNVLGIQVNTTRGDLTFDTNGNLVISDEWSPINREKLILSYSTPGSGGIGPSTYAVAYDGSAEITIEIGPGLKLE